MTTPDNSPTELQCGCQSGQAKARIFYCGSCGFGAACTGIRVFDLRNIRRDIHSGQIIYQLPARITLLRQEALSRFCIGIGFGGFRKDLACAAKATSVEQVAPRFATGCFTYHIERILPKSIFRKDYPENPKTFGEHLRKARIDAGLQIKNLARKLRVIEDTMINWEVRGRIPKGRSMEALGRVFGSTEA